VIVIKSCKTTGKLITLLDETTVTTLGLDTTTSP